MDMDTVPGNTLITTGRYPDNTVYNSVRSASKGTIDAASGFYFLGRKEKDYLLSDKELLSSYRGFRYSAEV
jgi:hypothetical protein